jgi:NAD(P)-dependent dehydrogenase (short-subunit alcohol dehydrogenase family)
VASPFSLAGKVAIITGGRRGIGRAIALALAEAGADVALGDRVIDDGELEAVAAEIKKLKRRSIAVQADITKKAEVDSLVQKTLAELGTIDILVNNAAMNIRAPLLELNEEGWDKVIDTDLKGYYLCSQAAGKVMVKQKRGNIINIASTAAMYTAPEMGAYCIAKAGVVMLTRMLAVELAQYNIRVNAVAPSMVKTKFSQPLWADPKSLKEIEAGIPLGRLAEPADIVGPVLFLASEASAYITGHTLVVDGGSGA